MILADPVNRVNDVAVTRDRTRLLSGSNAKIRRKREREVKGHSGWVCGPLHFRLMGMGCVCVG